MAFRALAIDLDGTLLVGEEVPAENIVALQRAHAAGYRIIIATARWVQMARRVAGLPFSRGSQTGLNKVLAALPEERRHQLRTLWSRIVVGAPASASSVPAR